MSDAAFEAPRVAVLGPIVVRGGTGEVETPTGQRALTLLAALCLVDRPLSVAELVDDVWGEAPPHNAKAALQTLVSRVRSRGADALIRSTTAGYALAVAPEQTDLGRARLSVDAAQAALHDGDVSGARDIAADALGLWRGGVGLELADGPVRDELEREAMSLRGRLRRIHAEALLADHDYEGALAALQRIPEALRTDDLVALQLRALAASGRRSDALRVFATYRERVRDELGVEPSTALNEVHTAILRETDEAPAATAPLKRGVRSGGTPLLGRDDDAAALEALMTRSRIVTILGPGGLGKTRLAHHVAERSADSVAVVELAGVRAGDDVTGAFAVALGIHEIRVQRLSLDDPAVRSSVTERILAALDERPTLLIVDNCEHVVDAAAAWVDEIVARTDHTSVLATSRAPLAVAAEQVYHLAPLPVGADGRPGSAVTLFRERARAARPGVSLPAETVRALCERLDGLPLAIELAAARVRSLSVDEVASRLADRFTLLDAGRRGGPDRHRTLSAVIDWSWNLLNPSQQATLSRLAYFASGFGVDAAEVVAASVSDDVLDDLDAVVAQSLLTADEEPTTGQIRYRMLETVREYALRVLVDAGEEPSVRAAAHRWAVDFAASTLARIDGPEQVSVLQRLAVEHDNLVAVLRELCDGDESESAAVVFSALSRFWLMRGAYNEILAFAPLIFSALRSQDEVVANPDASAMAAAIAAFALTVGGNTRDAIRARRLLRRIRENFVVTDPLTTTVSDLMLAWGDAAEVYRRVWAASQSPDPHKSAPALLISAQILENTGDVETAFALATSAVEQATAVSNLWLVSLAELSLAEIHSQSARPDEVAPWAERAQGNFGRLGAAETFVQTDWLVALSLISTGELEQAEARFHTLVERVSDGDLGRDARDLELIAVSGLAEVAWARGDGETARRLFTEASADITDNVRESNPWALVVAGAALAVLTESGMADEASTWSLARRVRRTTRVLTRVRGPFHDRPVLGAVLVGLGRWWLEAADSAVGVELLALGERLSSRQDLPTLWREPHFNRARQIAPGAEVEAARERARALSLDEAAARGLEVLRRSRLTE